MKYAVFILLVAGCSKIVEFEKECDADFDCPSFLICQDGACVEPAPPPAACRILYGLSDDAQFHNKSALRIGLMMPRSGEFKSDGEIMEKVIGTAIFEINQTMDAGGQNFVVVGCDSSGTSDEVVTRATWLIEQARVPILIGPIDGDKARAVFRRVAQQSRVLQIFPQLRPGSAHLQSDDGLLLKLVAPETSQFEAMVKVLNAKGYEKVASLRPDTHQGTHSFQSFESVYCGQVDCENKPVLDIVYGASREIGRGYFDVSSIDSALRAFGPEVLLFLGTADEFITLAEHEETLESLNGRPLFGTHYLHDAMSLQSLGSQGQSLVNQLIGFLPSSLDGDAYGDFSDWFSARFPDIPAHLGSTAAFDSIFLAAYLYASQGSSGAVEGPALARQLSRITQGEEPMLVGLESFASTREVLQSNGASTIDLFGTSGALDFEGDYTTRSAVDAWYYDTAAGQIRILGEIFSSKSEYQEGVIPEIGTR
ncbi:MAG: ABC transporter substrate-binding protein [Myxococcota bacterium]|nr:ABC transporter substrate-binding protein [Myxococcota bacterium]